jgi:predicted dehydrogenase
VSFVRTRLGFAGVGALGEALIRDVAQFPDRLSVVALQDTRPDLAASIATKYGVERTVEAYEQLVGLPDVDAIVICTPNAFHAPQAQTALRAGKDVLVQKPLALSRADAQTTIDLAHACRQLLFVDYSYRFLETTDGLRKAISEIGPVRSARAAFHNIYGPGAEKTWFFDARLSGGGALIDLGVHLLDLALWLLQPGQVRVLSADLSPRDMPVESSSTVTVRLDGVEFTLEVSWNSQRPLTEICFEVESLHGSVVRWENVEGSFFRFRTVRDGQVLLERETTLRADTLRAFADALASRQAPPVDVRVYDVLDAAYARVG